MESRTIDSAQEIIETRNFARNSFSEKEAIEPKLVYKKLADEGSENYFSYIDWLGLSNESNVILLSSSHHYYYEDEDLKDVQILINQKPLNYIKQLKDFLQTIYQTLPQKTYFIGSFVDGSSSAYFSMSDKTQNQSAGRIDPVENGISSRIPLLNIIYDIMDARTNRYLTKKTTAVLLEAAGFTILNMREINGLTYFQANTSSAEE